VDETSSKNGGFVSKHKLNLEEPIDREPGEDDVREKVHDGENGENHPVGEPLGVVVLVTALESLHRSVGRVNEPNHIAQKLGAVAPDKPEDSERQQAWRKEYKRKKEKKIRAFIDN
jgi:hypothetical protein